MASVGPGKGWNSALSRGNEGQPDPRGLFALWKKIAQMRRVPHFIPRSSRERDAGLRTLQKYQFTAVTMELLLGRNSSRHGPYSLLSACIGSIREARRAGMNVARAATKQSNSPETPSAKILSWLGPSNDATQARIAKVRHAPTATPTRTRRKTFEKRRVRIWDRLEPRAIRIPNSRSRRLTE